MKRRILIAVAGIVLVAVVWLVMANRSASNGPVYQGKTARQWFGDLSLSGSNRTKAYAAFREMDSKAFPFLVQELQRTDSAWDKFYWRNYPKLPESVRKHVSPPSPLIKDLRIWEDAAAILTALKARTAIPDLTCLLADGNWPRQNTVLEALDNLVNPSDTNAIPPLISCLRSSNDPVCIRAIFALESIRPDERAIPALTNLINTRDYALHLLALDYLRRIDPKMAAMYEQ